MEQDKNREDDLRKYKDPSGISLRDMNFGLWFSENRRWLTRALTVFLILLSAFFFIYSTYAYIIYFMRGPIDNQPENQVMSPRNVVSDMKSGPIETFKLAETYDVAIALENPNDNFWAEFQYCFYQGQTVVACGQSFILPAEKKYVASFNLELANNTALSFRIEDIFWSRINRRQIPDWPEFVSERINMEISNIEFFNASRSGLSENLRLNSLEFLIFNKSPFSYYQVDFEVLLYSGSSLVAIEQHVAKDLLAEEKREVKMSWLGDIPVVNSVEIRPRVNIIKDEVYLRYQGGY